MRGFKLLILFLLIVALGSVTLLGRQQLPKRYRATFQAEDIIRRIATKTVMPVYPEDVLQAGVTGLVDVAVRFDEHGKADRVKVLESPDPALSKAVEHAVKQWTIKPQFSADLVPMFWHGELRFYFVIRDGTGVVESPPIEQQRTRSEAFVKIANQESHRRPEK